MRRVAVYCGSRAGEEPIHAELATAVATELVARGTGIVMGGGAVGLMGVVADTALTAGGEVIGVIPKLLADREVAHARLTELHVVGSMHERKLLMTDLSAGFVVLSGGIGTLDELVEAFTWNQLNIHDKPIAVLNADGYYDELLAFLDRSVRSGFLGETQRRSLIVRDEPAALLDALFAAMVLLSDSSRSLLVVFGANGLIGPPPVTTPAGGRLRSRARRTLENAPPPGHDRAVRRPGAAGPGAERLRRQLFRGERS